jgi:hypothetical protein
MNWHDWRIWRAAWLVTWAVILVTCLVLWLVAGAAGCTLVWVEGDGNRVTEPGGDVHVERATGVGLKREQRQAP